MKIDALDFLTGNGNERGPREPLRCRKILDAILLLKPLINGLNTSERLRMYPDRLAACAIHHHKVTARKNVSDLVFATVIGHG